MAAGLDSRNLPAAVTWLGIVPNAVLLPTLAVILVTSAIKVRQHN
jgi:hypothetical protein